MTDVQTTNGGGAVAALQQLKSGLQNVSATLPKAGGDALLRMLKDGGWVYGQDNAEVEEGSIWAVGTMTIQHGYASWTRKGEGEGSNQLVGEVMVPMTHPQPARGDLPSTGWDWSDQLSFLLKCTTGEDVDTQVLYKTTSVGGINAGRELINAIIAQLDVDETKPLPMVELHCGHYQHKKYGKTYTPEFKIVGWAPLEGPAPAKAAAAPAAASSEATEGATPPADAEAAPATTRRRRRPPSTP